MTETQEVPRVRTPLSFDQAIQYIAEAYRLRTGQAASNKTLAILGAQWALETGRGQSMFNWNFGNITTQTRSWPNGWFMNPAGDTKTSVHYYRNYTEPFEGAKDFVNTLKSNYWLAFDAAKAGNVHDFVYRLKNHPWTRGSTKATKAYFEASLESYLDNMRPLTREYFLRLEGEQRPPFTVHLRPVETSEAQPSSALLRGACSLLKSAEAERLDTLKISSCGADVAYLQILVGTKCDGMFGPLTETAVRLFQASAGLKIDGIVGPKTWAALKLHLGD